MREETRKTSFSTNDGRTQTIIVNQKEHQSNAVGTAGFVLSIIALFVGWVPVLGWLLWLLGAVLSFVGVFNKPRGFAIAGLVISFIGVILLIFVFAGIALLGALSA